MSTHPFASKVAWLCSASRVAWMASTWGTRGGGTGHRHNWGRMEFQRLETLLWKLGWKFVLTICICGSQCHEFNYLNFRLLDIRYVFALTCFVAFWGFLGEVEEKHVFFHDWAEEILLCLMAFITPFDLTVPLFCQSSNAKNISLQNWSTFTCSNAICRFSFRQLL